MTSLLEITPGDIKKKLNPTNAAHLFLGAQSAVVEADVEECIDEIEAVSLSRVHARYVELFYHINGLWLAGGRRSLPGGARGGETEFVLPLLEASDVRLYKNYSGAWSQRAPGDALRLTTDYTVAEVTGVVTVTLVEALSEGDTLIAEFSHEGMGECLTLRKIVKDLVAAEWARRLYADDERWDRYKEWEEQAYSDLTRAKPRGDGGAGIMFFDALDLVEETKVGRAVADPYDPSGLMM